MCAGAARRCRELHGERVEEGWNAGWSQINTSKSMTRSRTRGTDAATDKKTRQVEQMQGIIVICCDLMYRNYNSSNKSRKFETRLYTSHLQICIVSVEIWKFTQIPIIVNESWRMPTCQSFLFEYSSLTQFDLFY